MTKPICLSKVKSRAPLLTTDCILCDFKGLFSLVSEPCWMQEKCCARAALDLLSVCILQTEKGARTQTVLNKLPYTCVSLGCLCLGHQQNFRRHPEEYSCQKNPWPEAWERLCKSLRPSSRVQCRPGYRWKDFRARSSWQPAGYFPGTHRKVPGCGLLPSHAAAEERPGQTGAKQAKGNDTGCG